MKRKHLIFLISMLTVLCLFCFAACNSAALNDYSKGGGAEAPQDADEAAIGETGNDIVLDSAGRLLVYDVSVDITVTDMAKTSAALKTKVSSLGGWLESGRESSTAGGASANLAFRVPTAELNGFLDTLDASGTVGYKSVDTTDVTTAYTSIQARITSLETEKTAINALLEKATSYSDIITLRDRLTYIDSQLGSYKLQKEKYDSNIEFSTVRVSLSTPYEQGVSAWDVFKDVLLVVLIVGIVLTVIVVFYLKNRRERKEAIRKNEERRNGQTYGYVPYGGTDQGNDRFRGYGVPAETPQNQEEDKGDRI